MKLALLYPGLFAGLALVYSGTVSAAGTPAAVATFDQVIDLITSDVASFGAALVYVAAIAYGFVLIIRVIRLLREAA